MIGETVVVERKIATGQNRHNQPIYAWTLEHIGNVLVAPGPSADIPDTARPEGVVVAWNLIFPRTFQGSLAGCRVSVRGQDPCDVIGDPQPWPAQLTPTRWSMVAEVKRADG